MELPVKPSLSLWWFRWALLKCRDAFAPQIPSFTVGWGKITVSSERTACKSRMLQTSVAVKTEWVTPQPSVARFYLGCVICCFETLIRCHSEKKLIKILVRLHQIKRKGWKYISVSEGRYVFLIPKE